VKLYFDECCSRRLSRELKQYYVEQGSIDLDVSHVLDFYDPATAESTWLQPLQDDRTWIPVTNDHGRNPKREKFHAVCTALGITYVVLTPTLIDAGYDEQKNALIAVWDQLHLLYRLPPGTKVTLGYGDPDGDTKTYCLRVKQKLLTNVVPN